MSEKIEQDVWTELFGVGGIPSGSDDNVILYFTAVRRRLEENLFFAAAHAQARANGQTTFRYDGRLWDVEAL
jgi:hypothetical protein